MLDRPIRTSEGLAHACRGSRWTVLDWAARIPGLETIPRHMTAIRGGWIGLCPETRTCQALLGSRLIQHATMRATRYASRDASAAIYSTAWRKGMIFSSLVHIPNTKVSRAEHLQLTVRRLASLNAVSAWSSQLGTWIINTRTGQGRAGLLGAETSMLHQIDRSGECILQIESCCHYNTSSSSMLLSLSTNKEVSTLKVWLLIYNSNHLSSLFISLLRLN